MNEDFLHNKLKEREEQGNLRQLRIPKSGMIDFCSNDYLGIVKNKLLYSVSNLLEATQLTGSTGSRLLSGNSKLIEETEESIAAFHAAEAALIFNSGYDANLGLLSAIARKDDTILYDQLSHASIRDGARLSFAQTHSFRHNDMDDLENKLQKSTGNRFVVTESVFSMDGDLSPLRDLVAVCEKNEARLIVDEAHATGVIGQKGEGLVQHLGLEGKIFARMHTFGKACGVHGAVVLGSKDLRAYLINFARPFIYSTALPGETIQHIRASYEIFPGLLKQREQLTLLIGKFQQEVEPNGTGFQCLPSNTPIQGLILPGNRGVKQLALKLQEKNLDLRPILYPTVPLGTERIRIVLHSFNTENEINLLANSLKNSD